MKAISIRQPWAWLIVNGYKDIENRVWNTKIRGRVLIHASQQFDSEGWKYVREYHKIKLPDRSAFKYGGIVGEAEIIDCVTESNSKWFAGQYRPDKTNYGFVLRGAKPLEFRPCRGQLSFFEPKYKDVI